MNFTLRPKAHLRSLAVLASAALALTLGACGGPVGGGGQGGQQEGGSSQEAGSATSGTVNWWGWTPTDTATANGLHRRVQQGIPRHQGQLQARLDPRLAGCVDPGSAVGQRPGCLRHAAGRLRQQVQVLHRGPDAGGRPRRLGDDWQSKVAPAGVERSHRGRQADRAVGRRGLLRHLVDQPGPVRQVRPEAADDARRVGHGLQDLQVARPGLLRAGRRRRRASTRTPCRRSRTPSSRASGRRPRRARRSGTTRASSRRWTSGSSCSTAASCRRARSATSSTRTPTTTS